MSYQPPPSFPTSNDGREDAVTIGWDDDVPLIYPKDNSYPAAPPYTSKRMRWVFLGPHPNPMDYRFLEELLENFDNEEYYGLILTAHRTSLSGFSERVHRLVIHRVKGYLEIRTLAPDLEMAVRRTVVSGELFVSSFLSTPVDALGNHLTALDVQNIRGLEVVHILPPSRDSLTSQESLDACLYALSITMYRATASGLLKCVLPLDLYEYLKDSLDIIARSNKFQELELTAPLSNDVLQISSRPTAGVNTITPLLPHLSRLHLHTFSIPALSVVERHVLAEVAKFPALHIFKLIFTPVPSFNPVKTIVQALNDAGITARGPGCFENLEILDLGYYDSDQPFYDEAIYNEIYYYISELQNILPGTPRACESRPSCLLP